MNKLKMLFLQKFADFLKLDRVPKEGGKDGSPL
jgi:hypothetical protein